MLAFVSRDNDDGVSTFSPTRVCSSMLPLGTVASKDEASEDAAPTSERDGATLLAGESAGESLRGTQLDAGLRTVPPELEVLLGPLEGRLCMCDAVKDAITSVFETLHGTKLSFGVAKFDAKP